MTARSAEHALESVNVDVLGTEDVNASASLNELKTRYAFVAEHDMSMTSSTPESDEMAADSPAMYDRVRLGHMSLAIAMVLAAGVRKKQHTQCPACGQ